MPASRLLTLTIVHGNEVAQKSQEEQSLYPKLLFNVNNMDADVLRDKMADYTWKLWGMSYTSPSIELIT